jgi:hypothetical protein
MRVFASFVGLLLFIGVSGCGPKPLNTTPLTEEEKAKIKQEDQRVEDEERGGSGMASSKKKKK